METPDPSKGPEESPDYPVSCTSSITSLPPAISIKAENKGGPIMKTIDYVLQVIQQPGGLTSCGFNGDKINRRVIDPCPILQLAMRDSQGELRTSATVLGNVSVMVVHAILYHENGKDDASFIQVETLRKDPRFQVYADQIQARGVGLDGPLAPVAYERLLEGSTVSSCYLLTDLYGNRGAYFVFEDLSVKMDGVYRIQFVLSELQQNANGPVSILNVTTFSEPFECFPPGSFLEPRESTPLSKHFAEQGVKIPLRNRIRARPGGRGGAGGTDEEPTSAS